MKQIKSEGKAIDNFHFKIEDARRLFKPLDEITDNFIDKCVSGAKKIYCDYLNDDNCSFKLFSFLDKLSKLDPGFIYNIPHNAEDNLTDFA